MDTVSFRRMDEGTPEDYAFLGKLEHDYIAALPDRLMDALRALESSLAGYKIDRLQHSPAIRHPRRGRWGRYRDDCGRADP